MVRAGFILWSSSCSLMDYLPFTLTRQAPPTQINLPAVNHKRGEGGPAKRDNGSVNRIVGFVVFSSHTVVV